MRILIKETSIQAPLEAVWHAWTSNDGLAFLEAEDGRVHVNLHAHGWQEGEPWQRGWDYFDHAWGLVLNSMKQHLEASA